MSKAQKDTTAIGLHIREERDNSYGYGREGYYHIRAEAITIGRDAYERAHPDDFRDVNADTVRWCKDGETNGLDLHDFCVNSQGGGWATESAERRRLYAWGVEYRQVHSIDARRAATMHKTLAMVEKRMERLDAKYGRAETFGAYLARVAEAIGATVMVRDSPQGKHAGKQHMSILDGVYAINQWVAQWVADGEPKAASA